MAKKQTKGRGYGSPDMLNELLAAAETSSSIQDLLNEVKKNTETEKPSQELTPDSESTNQEEIVSTNHAESKETVVAEKPITVEQPLDQEPAGVAEQKEALSAQDDEVEPESTEGERAGVLPEKTEVKNITGDKPIREGKTAISKKSGGRTSEVKEKNKEQYNSLEAIIYRKNEKQGSLKFAYLLPETHAYIEILQAYGKHKKIKTSMQDITANIVKWFVQNHREEMKEMIKALNEARRGLDL